MESDGQKNKGQVRPLILHPSSFILLLVLGVGAFIFIREGFRWEYWAASTGLVIPAFAGRRGLAWARYGSLFWGVGVLYIHLPLLLPYRLEPVHVEDLYRAELRWFGMGTDAGQIPAEWFAVHNHPVVDFFTGLAYILYLYQPFVFYLLFFFREPDRARMLAQCFFIASLLGMATYLLYPAAPPWYVMDVGFGPAQPDTPPSMAGAARFDQLTGLSYFSGFYSRNANVFGAMPSLHAAYPLLCAMCVFRLGRTWFIPCAGFALLVGFAAVYLQHHYVFDVLAGYLYAGMAAGLVAAADCRRRRSRSRRG